MFSDDTDAFLSEAKKLAEGGNFVGALNIYKSSLNKIKDDATKSIVYMNIGVLLSRTGDLEDALKYLQKSIELKETDLALFHRGNIFLDMGQPERALQDFENSLDINPHWTTYCGKSVAHLSLNQILDAYEAINEAIKMNPSRYELYFKASDVAIMLEKGEEALNFQNKGTQIKIKKALIEKRYADLVCLN